MDRSESDAFRGQAGSWRGGLAIPGIIHAFV